MNIKLINKTPPKITYTNRPAYYKQLVADAAKTVRLSGRATA